MWPNSHASLRPGIHVACGEAGRRQVYPPGTAQDPGSRAHSQTLCHLSGRRSGPGAAQPVATASAAGVAPRAGMGCARQGRIPTGTMSPASRSSAGRSSGGAYAAGPQCGSGAQVADRHGKRALAGSRRSPGAWSSSPARGSRNWFRTCSSGAKQSGSALPGYLAPHQSGELHALPPPAAGFRSVRSCLGRRAMTVRSRPCR